MKRITIYLTIVSIFFTSIFIPFKDTQANPVISIVTRALFQTLKKSFTKAGMSGNASAVGNSQLRLNNLLTNTYNRKKLGQAQGPYLNFFQNAKNSTWLGLTWGAYLVGPIYAWTFGTLIGDKILKIIPQPGGSFLLERRQEGELEALTPGSPFWALSVNNGSSLANARVPYSLDILNQIAQNTAVIRGKTLGECRVNQATPIRYTYVCNFFNPNGTLYDDDFYIAEHYTTQTITVTCESGQFYKNGSCIDSTIPLVAPEETVVTTYPNIDDLIVNLTEEEKSLPMTPETLAMVANQVVDTLEQNDPLFPPPPTSITPELVEEAMQGVRYPTLGDLATPWDIAPTAPPYSPPIPANPSTPVPPGTVPETTVPNQSYSPGETTPEEDDEAVEVDFGPDPGISLNELEDIPDGKQIIEPLIFLIPGVREWQLPNYSIECPTPTFTVFNRDITMTAHCEIASQIRPEMYAVFVAIWTFIAFLIVLGA